MHYLIIDRDGRLVSESSVVADPLPDGLTAVALAERPDWATHRWDPAVQQLVSVSARRVRTLDKAEFLRRLTLGALAAALARESTDPLIAAFRVWIDNVTRVDLDTAEVQQGIGYLQQMGILTAEHAAQILQDGAAT